MRKKPKKPSEVTRAKKLSPRTRAIWIALITLMVSLAVLGAGYLLLLDREIVSRFEGRRWRLPSKIYSDTFSLYTGGPFRGSHLQNRLRRLGYQPSKQRPPRKGEYRVGRGFMEITLHDFLYPSGEFEGFPVRIETEKGAIKRLQDLREPAKEIYAVDLEPELITGL